MTVHDGGGREAFVLALLVVAKVTPVPVSGFLGLARMHPYEPKWDDYRAPHERTSARAHERTSARAHDEGARMPVSGQIEARPLL